MYKGRKKTKIYFVFNKNYLEEKMTQKKNLYLVSMLLQTLFFMLCSLLYFGYYSVRGDITETCCLKKKYQGCCIFMVEHYYNVKD